jgi:leader peptidase (prepilin peptidase)/N-methyltransferase
MLWILVPAAATVGAVAGAVMRIVLGRLPRGTRVRPPLCEVAVAGLWAATGLGWVVVPIPARWLPALLGLAWLAVAVAVVDLRHHRIPDALTLPALPVALACVVPLGGAAVGRALVGAGLAVAVHAVVHLVAPRSMGPGDVKLAAPLGAVLGAAGWLALPVAAVLASVLTAVVGVASMLARGVRGRSAPILVAFDHGSVEGGSVAGWWPRGSPVPHGPSMVLAAVVATAGFAVAGAGPGPDAGPPGPGPVSVGCDGGEEVAAGCVGGRAGRGLVGAVAGAGGRG